MRIKTLRFFRTIHLLHDFATFVAFFDFVVNCGISVKASQLSTCANFERITRIDAVVASPGIYSFSCSSRLHNGVYKIDTIRENVVCFISGNPQKCPIPLLTAQNWH